MERFRRSGRAVAISAEASALATGGRAAGDYSTALATRPLTEHGKPDTPTRITVSYLRKNPFLRGFSQPIIPPRPR
jgi:hypothetical protein